MDSKPWKPKTAKRQRTGTQINAPHKLHAVCKYISGGKKTKKKKKKKKSNVLSFAAALILRSRKDLDEADAGFFGFHSSSSSASSTTDLLSHKLPLLTEPQWLKIVLVVVVVLQDHQAKDSLAPFLAFKEESWSPPAAKARLATEDMSAIEEGGAWPHTPKNTHEGEFY
jgi:hypothetical protein